MLIKETDDSEIRIYISILPNARFAVKKTDAISKKVILLPRLLTERVKIYFFVRALKLVGTK